MKKVDIYTDGACSGNPGVGGYGAVLIFNGIEKQISGRVEETTNNRMELLAVIKALQCLKEPCDIKIYSDSAYVVNAFLQGWIFDWQKKNWRLGTTSEVKNIDLWQELLQELSKHKFLFVKVKGHSENAYNNLCDLLATNEVKATRE